MLSQWFNWEKAIIMASLKRQLQPNDPIMLRIFLNISRITNRLTQPAYGDWCQWGGYNFLRRWLTYDIYNKVIMQTCIGRIQARPIIWSVWLSNSERKTSQCNVLIVFLRAFTLQFIRITVGQTLTNRIAVGRLFFVTTPGNEVK